ncbi:GT2 family glycosyltransferase [Neomicrococcus aestuarii]|uniref:GT2 family glycosyltransferase n=1 Tax=Neomicrococcus aestuarii TaxID=556325 RepID=A0A7W8TRG9_9MICC|nr:glycosyltransferase family 2 protein [Neomicrococcus aestuarii]MBB5511439.1 GT2 family glycosyltransferase [Neomicrococcus aestuarii]
MATCAHASLSAVVPHYGDPSEVQNLVGTLLRDAAGCLREVIVVDDSSPTPFPESWQPTHQSSAVFTVIRRPQNGGFGAAVNTGLEATKTDLAIILNSDLMLPQNFIEDLQDAAAPWHPAVMSPEVTGLDGSTQWTARHFPTVTHQVVEWLSPLARFRQHTLLHEAVGHDTRAVEGKVIPVDWVFGAAMLLPVKEVRTIGGFDESFFMNAEEVDLQRRLRDIGVPSIYLGTVNVAHVGGGSSDPERRRRWLVESRHRYAQKWGNPNVLKGALTAASFTNFAVNAVRKKLGRDIDSQAVLRQELSYLKDQKTVNKSVRGVNGH